MWFPNAYVNEIKTFEEGKRRAREFDINIDEYLEREIINYQKINTELTKNITVWIRENFNF